MLVYTISTVDTPDGKNVDFWICESHRGMSKGSSPEEAFKNLLFLELIQIETEWELTLKL